MINIKAFFLAILSAFIVLLCATVVAIVMTYFMAKCFWLVAILVIGTLVAVLTFEFKDLE